MALALEKEKAENGEPKFSKQEVLRWLDEVRRMGHDRTFLK